MKAMVENVTSEYLKDRGVVSGVYYPGVKYGEYSFELELPDGSTMYCFNDGNCAQLEDNEVKVWTVSED